MNNGVYALPGFMAPAAKNWKSQLLTNEDGSVKLCVYVGKPGTQVYYSLGIPGWNWGFIKDAKYFIDKGYPEEVIKEVSKFADYLEEEVTELPEGTVIPDIIINGWPLPITESPIEGKVYWILNIPKFILPAGDTEVQISANGKLLKYTITRPDFSIHNNGPGYTIPAGTGGNTLLADMIAEHANDTSLHITGEERADWNERLTSLEGSIESVAGDLAALPLRYGSNVAAASDECGDKAIALGNNNKATNAASTSIGDRNSSTGSCSTTLGASNEAAGDYSTALGNVNSSTGKYATTLGYNNTATKQYAIALGSGNKAKESYAIAIGCASNATKQYTTTLGYGNQATGNFSTALGTSNQSTGSSSTTLGYNNYATTQYAIALGRDNEARGDHSVALGHDNESTGFSSTALGAFNKSTSTGSIALGCDNEATAIHAIAIGFTNTAPNESTAVGIRNEAAGNFSTALGYWNSAAEYQATAVGCYNKATDRQTTALGYNNNATSDYSTALGYWNSATGFFSTSLGGYNDAAGEQSVALGSYNDAAGEQSVAVGIGSYTGGYNSVAIGISARACKEGSLVISATNKKNGTSVSLELVAGAATGGDGDMFSDDKFITDTDVKLAVRDMLTGKEHSVSVSLTKLMQHLVQDLQGVSEFGTEAGSDGYYYY